MRRGVVVITTVQLHSTKPELRFCAGSNPARGVSEIRDGEDLWQWSRLEIRLNTFRRSTIPHHQFINSFLAWLFSWTSWTYRSEHTKFMTFEVTKIGLEPAISNLGDQHSTEAVIRRCSVKNVLLKAFQNWRKNKYARISFLIRLQVDACNLIKKENLAQVFSCVNFDKNLGTRSFA